MREGDEPSRFGSIQAKIRERRAADLTEAASDDPNAPYEVIAEANDLSENVARMQLYALGFNRAGFAYRGDRQNSNTFAGAALSAGKLPAATGVAHDPIGRPGELSEFFVPGLNEPLRTPIGRRSSDQPNAAPALREAKYKIPAFPDIPVSTFAKEAPAQTPVFQTDNASTIGGIGKFIGDRLMATGEAPSSTRVGLPSRMVSSSFPELTPGNPRQPSSPQQSAPLLGIFSNKPMSPSPLPASLWGLPDNCEASDEGN